MNLNKLRDKAYQCAVAHGWHEENLSDEHFLCLVAYSGGYPFSISGDIRSVPS